MVRAWIQVTILVRYTVQGPKIDEVGISLQCPKLRVHPAPSVHISTAGCTIFKGVHPVCARFLSHLLLIYIGRVHGAISGCIVFLEVHPASAQTKILISDTGLESLHFLNDSLDIVYKVFGNSEHLSK